MDNIDLSPQEKKRMYRRRYYQANKEKWQERALYEKTNYPEKLKEKWTRSNANRVKARREYDLKKIYGLPLSEYETMFARQKGLCAICGEPETLRNNRSGKLRDLAVDHDHETGKVRALLCYNCNLMIGFAKESTDRLEKGASYLTKYNDKNVVRKHCEFDN